MLNTHTISETIARKIISFLYALLIILLPLAIYKSDIKPIQIIDKVNCGLTITNSYQGVNITSPIITKTIMNDSSIKQEITVII